MHVAKAKLSFALAFGNFKIPDFDQFKSYDRSLSLYERECRVKESNSVKHFGLRVSETTIAPA